MQMTVAQHGFDTDTGKPIMRRRWRCELPDHLDPFATDERIS